MFHKVKSLKRRSRGVVADQKALKFSDGLIIAYRISEKSHDNKWLQNNSESVITIR
jgi:hypothetical protein